MIELEFHFCNGGEENITNKYENEFQINVFWINGFYLSLMCKKKLELKQCDNLGFIGRITLLVKPVPVL